MKPRFIIERSGKQFVLYAGLLDEATGRGLKSIVTTIAQVPTGDNDNTAICQAVVTMLGVDGLERTFCGIGDASPRNVTPAMLTCLLRISETRSKARALRDAINVGMCSFEELGNEQDTTVHADTSGAACPECRTTGKYHAVRCSRRERAAAA